MDVVLLGLGESVGSGVARLLQALRILKLLRLVRLSRIMRRLVARSSIDLSLLELLKFGTLTLLMAHWLACLWGFAGNNFSDNEVRGHAKRRRVLRLIASLSACAVCPTSTILLCPSELLSSLLSPLSSLLSPLSPSLARATTASAASHAAARAQHVVRVRLQHPILGAEAPAHGRDAAAAVRRRALRLAE